MDKPKMICPYCGAEMNHHAMKIDYSVDDPSSIDPAFGGVVQEAHYCPECGRSALRQA
jgi:rRNA maturation endonuclease Nob1